MSAACTSSPTRRPRRAPEARAGARAGDSGERGAQRAAARRIRLPPRSAASTTSGNIDNKSFQRARRSRRSRRSASGLYVKTKYTTAVATPTTLRRRSAAQAVSGERGTEESTWSTASLCHQPRRRFIVVGNNPKSEETSSASARSPTATERAATFNPDGILTGAWRSPSPGPTPTSSRRRTWWSVSLDDPFHPEGDGDPRRPRRPGRSARRARSSSATASSSIATD